MKIQYTIGSNSFSDILELITILVAAVLSSLIMAWPIQLLWNWIIPDIFGLGEITFFQAFGLKLLLYLMLDRIDS